MSRFESFKDANHHALEKEAEILEHAVAYEEGPEVSEVNPDTTRYFFVLQSEIEKGDIRGNLQEDRPIPPQMDYHVYAEVMWEELAGSPINDEVRESESFSEFRNRLILGLHRIDMKDIVYEDVRLSMPRLIERYGGEIRRMALWTKGDVESTGYQPAKIMRSNIAGDFYRTLRKQVSRDDARAFIETKTAHFIEDDKTSAAVEFVKEGLSDSANEVKLVIIEDSRGNFQKVRQALENSLSGEDLKRVTLVPIWAAYSRAGEEARRRAETQGSTEELEKEMSELNSLDSFSDLLDENRFGPLFKDAHVLIDFDGVIGDNIAMRREQANVIYSALVAGLERQNHKKREDIDLDVARRAREALANRDKQVIG